MKPVYAGFFHFIESFKMQLHFFATLKIASTFASYFIHLLRKNISHA